MSTEVPLQVDLTTLPDDPALLKQLVMQLFAELQQQRAKLAKQQHQMDLLLRKLYGRSSEKFHPDQKTLFDLQPTDAEPPVDPRPSLPEPPPLPPAAKKPRPHGRRKAPDTLERVLVTHDLTDAEKALLGGEANLTPLPDEVTEQWEWTASCLHVIEHHQKKYAMREPRATAIPPSDAGVASHDTPPTIGSGEPAFTSPMIVAPKPSQAIPGGVAGPGLLAQVIVSKAGDHLPLYRQERIWERMGLPISRSTTCDWWLVCAELFEPLVELMRGETLASGVLHIDDTHVDICDTHRKVLSKGRLWARIGDYEHPCVVFDYTPDRSRAGPDKLLAGYCGYVQADAYSGYDGVFLESSDTILEVACWGHARRKFHDARNLDNRALLALAHIRQLYAIEKQLREACAGEWREWTRAEQFARIAATRQEQARPLLDEFKTWLERERSSLLPQNPVRQAMEYVLNHWAAFRRYTDDGRLNIDNNAAEREMKHFAVGRKNWLFCGSERGARAAAIHFSLIATCRRHRLEPWAYLRDLLVRLPVLRDRRQLTTEHLRPLLPYLWRPA